MSNPKNKNTIVASFIAALALAAVLLYANYFLIDPNDPFGGVKSTKENKG